MFSVHGKSGPNVSAPALACVGKNYTSLRHEATPEGVKTRKPAALKRATGEKTRFARALARARGRKTRFAPALSCAKANKTCFCSRISLRGEKLYFAAA